MSYKSLTRASTTKQAVKKKIMLSALSLVMLILTIIVIRNLNISLIAQQQRDTKIEQLFLKLEYVSSSLSECYYEGEYNQNIDSECLKKLAIMSRLVDRVPDETSVYALIWSGTHSYLDAKYDTDKQIERLIKKSVIETEIASNEVSITDDKHIYLKALKKAYQERMRGLPYY